MSRWIWTPGVALICGSTWTGYRNGDQHLPARPVDAELHRPRMPNWPAAYYGSSLDRLAHGRRTIRPPPGVHLPQGLARWLRYLRASTCAPGRNADGGRGLA